MIKINFTKDDFIALDFNSVSVLSSGALFLLFKCFDYYNKTKESPTVKQLLFVSGYSTNTFYLYYNELRDKKLLSDKAMHPSLKMIKETVVPKLVKLNIGEEGDVEEPVKRKKSNIKETMENIQSTIMIPFTKELKLNCPDYVLTKIAKNAVYGKIRKVLNQYEGNLDFADIFNILMFAMKDDFVIKKSLYLDIDYIFFRSSLVNIYLQDKLRTIPSNIPADAKYVCNRFGEKLNPSDFGYFEHDGYRYKLIVPRSPDSVYQQVNREIFNRMKGKTDSKYDKYLDGIMLKKEYQYLSGYAGENNKFVKEK